MQPGDPTNSSNSTMLFNSVAFLVFFPVVTAAYFGTPNTRARLIILLIASCIFYMAFVPAYILILVLTICVDYVAGILIAGTTVHRRRFLLLSLVTNISVLAVFKYYAFLSDNVGWLAGAFGQPAPLPGLRILLPIGLSFHTFQAMSYTIEVYYGRQEPERDFLIYSLYVLFYPQLVAGPIERPQNLLPQFHQRHSFEYARVTSGLRRMAWGLCKKVVVADRLAAVVDLVYDNLHQYHGLALIVVTVMFAFQIYFDFSAYSDIALGAAQVMGFSLMENFRTPYFSRSISEFWRRWHISLSTWFKDYLYIPLGGSRVGTAKNYRNLLLVFILSGLWHGAGWTFVIWGALHGLYLICGNATRTKRARIWELLQVQEVHPLRRALACLCTFALVTFAWIFFRARTLNDSVYVIAHMFSGVLGDLLALRTNGTSFPVPGVLPRLILIGLVLGVEASTGSWERLDSMCARASLPLRYAIYLILIYGTVFGANDGAAQQFIYFQF